MDRLFLKYRPRTFEEVIGQSHVTVPIMGAIKSGSYPRSLLFSGIHGTGKTTLARIVSMVLNCEADKKPCLQCQSCRTILAQTNQDIIEINSADHRGIEAIRSIIDRAQYSPLGKAKVFILDEVHRLTTDAQNSLLKILEEPPQNVYFILATTEKDKLLPTILSRCQIHDLRRVTEEDLIVNLKRILQGEGKELDELILVQIAQEAKGSVRDSVSLLEKLLEFEDLTVDNLREKMGQADTELVKLFAKSLITLQLAGAFTVIEEVVKVGTNMEQFSVEVEKWFQKLLYAKAGVPVEEEAIDQASLTSTGFLVKCLDSLTKWKTRFMPVARLNFETAAADIIGNYVSQATVAVNSVATPRPLGRAYDAETATTGRPWEKGYNVSDATPRPPAQLKNVVQSPEFTKPLVVETDSF